MRAWFGTAALREAGLHTVLLDTAGKCGYYVDSGRSGRHDDDDAGGVVRSHADADFKQLILEFCTMGVV
jgi:hypothetical protein